MTDIPYMEQLNVEIIIQFFSSLYTWYLHDHRTKIYHMTSDKLLKTREKVMQNFGLNIVERPILVITLHTCVRGGWLVVFGFNGPLRQYFSQYRAVSQREGERGE